MKLNTQQVEPVISNMDQFDPDSGSFIERIVFNYRGAVLLAGLAVILFLGYQMIQLNLNANFEKTIPTGHPYIVNYLKHKTDLAGLGNAVSIAVETTKGTIYDADYLDTLQKVANEVFLIPGVERNYMKSLWSPGTRWAGVTENGFDGGPVIPNNYNKSARSVEEVRRNVERSGEIGQMVALNHRSSIIFVPLMSKYGKTGLPLDYGQLSKTLETLRTKYESNTIKIHITGFAKVSGDLIEGIEDIIYFFAFAVLISAIVLFWYTRCLSSILLVVTCSGIGVVLQLGISFLLGSELNPYSVLVPFLIFAIGMSHGAQIINGTIQEIGRGTHKVIAARYTFRRLFLPGFTALVSDAVGFGVLMIIDIGVIQELAIIACVGVAGLIFTNLIILLILLSYTGVCQPAAERSFKAIIAGEKGEAPHPIWRFLDLFTQRKWAVTALVCGVILAIGGLNVSQDLKIGDLDPGAPELRADSRYNKDNKFMRENYGASTDILAVMVETPEGACCSYETMIRIDALEWELRQLDSVESTNSLALLNRRVLTGLNEGSMKWYDLLHNQAMLNFITTKAPREFYNASCSLSVLYVYLKDHKADTLTEVVNAVEKFASKNNTKNAVFQLAAGSAGIGAATNIVVKQANKVMLFWVYGAIILLCLITFRNWRAVLCAVLPLMLTSILAEALMVKLGMGVTVATLPVIALGVGIGVDYAIYLLNVMKAELLSNKTLSEAYYCALLSTGKVVILIGITLSCAVATWVFSPIKFQADMGVMLAFMFLWNMMATLTLMPSLAYFFLSNKKEENTLSHGKS